MDVQGLRDQLAGWYHTRRRHLPWREEPTPYRVWVSEIMLQQTQVATVVPYFGRFIDAFPGVQALADAPEQDVLSLWSGLGYYRRARWLHAAAKQVVSRHGGRLPDTVAELLELPGVGRYTAGAIASVAYGRVEPVLDGNVARVLARVVALETSADSAAGQRALWNTATRLVDPTDPSSHNQALMELGALVCSPKRPACDGCPIGDHCAASARGEAERFPIKKARRQATPVRAVCGLVRDRSERVLLAQRPAGLLGGLWELPGAEVDTPLAAFDAVRRALAERAGLRASAGRHVATVRHVFSHRKLTLEVWAVDSWAGPPRQVPAETSWYPELRWLAPADVESVPLSTLTRKVLVAARVTGAAP